MLESIRVRSNIIRAIVATMFILYLVHSSHPGWVWLGWLINAISIGILVVAVAGVGLLFWRGRQAYRALTNLDKNARERFEKANHLGSGTSKASEAVVEGEIIKETKSAK